MLQSISAFLALNETEELSPAAREACYRDAIWSERAHWSARRNADRMAAFEANKVLFRLVGVGGQPRLLAPIKGDLSQGAADLAREFDRLAAGTKQRPLSLIKNRVPR